MNATRCVHDFLPGQCAICLGHDKTPPPTITHTFTARFDGRCAENPAHPIAIGETLGWTDDGQIVCQRCVEAAS